ncbi:uncharacterized protein ARMOST_05554 [Armillaria ostoyae]|uniref:Long chronological lifespan protein 2 n=1 Tax=Armillaria ostoyae TaxID=47428 RepID=A0A284R0I2_ARMOS|nr:uncharacterized protein ARMOST_05554 [Armillaria ostoyae]
MLSSLSFALIFMVGLISAQFNFFDGMFRHQEQHQPSGASQWAAHSEGISCNRYLCPATLECVRAPRECPCPNVEDIKCGTALQEAVDVIDSHYRVFYLWIQIVAN